MLQRALAPAVAGMLFCALLAGCSGGTSSDTSTTTTTTNDSSASTTANTDTNASPAAGGPTVGDISTGPDDHGKIGTPTTTFQKGVTRVDVQAPLSGATDKDTATLTFYAIGADAGGKDLKLFSQDIKLNSSYNNITGDVEMKKGLPVSKYRVDIAVNGTVAKSANFEVTQ